MLSCILVRGIQLQKTEKILILHRRRSFAYDFSVFDAGVKPDVSERKKRQPRKRKLENGEEVVEGKKSYLCPGK